MSNTSRTHLDMAFISPTCTIGDSSTLWHKRLGHANMEVILKLISMSLVRDLPKLDFINHSCNTCKIGNQVHASLKLILIRHQVKESYNYFT